MKDMGSAKLLVIGYGNELRRDDGLGPVIALAIEDLQLAGVVTFTRHQLTPELAEPISRAQCVLFVDAALGVREETQLKPLNLEGSQRPGTHIVNPAVLLALARDLFGRCPPGWWLTAPGADFSFGDGLSKPGQAAKARAIAVFLEFWAKLQETRDVPLT